MVQYHGRGAVGKFIHSRQKLRSDSSSKDTRSLACGGTIACGGALLLGGRCGSTTASLPVAGSAPPFGNSSPSSSPSSPSSSTGSDSSTGSGGGVHAGAAAAAGPRPRLVLHLALVLRVVRQPPSRSRPLRCLGAAAPVRRRGTRRRPRRREQRDAVPLAVFLAAHRFVDHWAMQLKRSAVAAGRSTTPSSTRAQIRRALGRAAMRRRRARSVPIFETEASEAAHARGHRSSRTSRPR